MAQRVTKNKPRPRKPFERSGLHRLDCPSCSGYAYSTVSQLETVGFPSCACGERLQPQRVELALMLGCDDAPIMLAYRAKLESVAHGQAWTGRDASTLNSPEYRALFGSKDEPGIVQEQRAAARARRIAALKPPAEPIPF